MKKTLLATALLGLATVSTAQAEVKYFTQLDLGMNHFKFNGHYNLPDWDSSVDKDWSSSKNNFTQSIAFGLDFDGSNRLAFDFTNFGKAYSEKWNEPNGINTNYNPNLNDHDYGKQAFVLTV